MSPIPLEEVFKRFLDALYATNPRGADDAYSSFRVLPGEVQRTVVLAVVKGLGLEYDEGTGQIWDPKAPRVEIPSDNSRRRRYRR